MKSVYIYFLLFFLPVGLFAQSIDFQHEKNWKEIVKQAKEENKLIFIDFYTDWCGPCLLMQEDVFPLKEVRTFYNTHFINAKIDAEKGEGIELKKKYKVKVFPTYIFVDPNTEEAVHQSTSRQEPETFIFTGQSALTPEIRSYQMQKRYDAGERDGGLLKNYAAYLHSCFQREKLDTLVNSYLSEKTIDLTDSLAWFFFVNYKKGSDSEAFAYMLNNRDKLNKLYGSKAVEEKISDGFFIDLSSVVMTGIYNSKRFEGALFDSLYRNAQSVSFTGKDYLLKKINVLNYFRQKKYTEAADIADGFLTDTTLDPHDVLDFCDRLVFLSRDNEDKEWILRALTYARFVAYNDMEKRSKADIHYNYAVMLEKALRLSTSGTKMFPDAILKAPQYGEKEYTLRTNKLKAKPKK